MLVSVRDTEDLMHDRVSILTSASGASMTATGMFVFSCMSVTIGRESSEVGVVEIEPSSDSFEEVEEVDSR